MSSPPPNLDPMSTSSSNNNIGGNSSSTSGSSSDHNGANPVAGREHRPMNDSTMPPPPPLSSTVPSSSATATTTTTTTTTTTSKPAVPVNPRHRFGLHDWKRLLAASTDLAQRKGAPLRRDITPEEVAQHNRNHDGWIILRGKVYTIGPYLPYHPGGVNIFRSVLGKDATPLFDKYHRWVNIDGLIGPLMLGTVLATTTPKPNPYNVIPPKESQLGNPPRVPVGGSLLLVQDEDEDDEDNDHLLLPPPPPRSPS